MLTKLLHPVAALFRQDGLGILVYLDDWLLMASDPGLLKDQFEYVSSTLHSLGFLLNGKNCIKVYRVSEFHNRLQEDDPVLAGSQGRQDTQGVPTRHILNLSEVTGCQLSYIIGLMTSVEPAVHPALLHYRALQHLRLEASGQKKSPVCSTSVKLSLEAVDYLQWWIHSLCHYSG